MPPLDRYRLYEHTVTNAAMLSRFCLALAPRGARILREDFSGTAALARGWLDLDPAHRALAVDLDARVLARAGTNARLVLLARDARRVRRRADVIAATNFPLGYFHERRGLVAYLRGVRASLHLGGVFLADTYGGASAFEVGTTRRRVRIPGGGWCWYEWEQREADPATGRVLNAIHFRVPARTGGGRARVIREAFVYDWRLWSIPELRDAMREAGLRRIEVYTRIGDAIDHLGNLYPRPVEAGEAFERDWVAYVVGRR